MVFSSMKNWQSWNIYNVTLGWQILHLMICVVVVRIRKADSNGSLIVTRFDLVLALIKIR